MVQREEITGLVLAGGRGSRMGGIDKGLQPLRGEPLVLHALRRLAPQVSRTMISANRHLDAYAQFGVPVWPDADATFAGPLAGLLAGLAHADTDWLLAVPCDGPRFPLDLAARLGAAAGGARVVVAATRHDGTLRREPAFCLLHRSLQAGLQRFVDGGGRKVEAWIDSEQGVAVAFDDRDAFVNANTADDLRRLAADG